MPTALFTPRRMLLIIAVVLLVNTMLPTRYATKLGYVPRAVITTLATPFGGPLKMVSDSLRGGPVEHPDYGTEQDMLLELERRHQQVVALEESLREAQDQIALLTQSREIALGGVRFVPTRVTGYSGDRVRPVITIDRGTAKGVLEGAPVVRGFNLVGRVIEAYPASADVELISARGTQMQVRILPPRTEDVPRELVEMIKLEEGGRWFEVVVEKDDPVEVGDLAHLIDERWPSEARGFVVGQVRRITPDPTDPLRFKEVVIVPLPPLDALSRVTVLAPVE